MHTNPHEPPELIEKEDALKPDSGISHTETVSTPPNTGHLKVDKKKAVVLSPQPTSDPNDPLNWPKWLKVRFHSVIFLRESTKQFRSVDYFDPGRVRSHADAI